jgi:outer membrane murein-binding lipoprotein Lpp
VPGDTNSAKIAKLEQTVATLNERLDNLREDVRRVSQAAGDSQKQFQDVDKRLAVAARDLDDFRKRLDDLLARRWELWKLVLAAFLGSVLTIAAGFVSRALDRWVSGDSARHATPVPASESRKP